MNVIQRNVLEYSLEAATEDRFQFLVDWLNDNADYTHKTSSEYLCALPPFKLKNKFWARKYSDKIPEEIKMVLEYCVSLNSDKEDPGYLLICITIS